MSANAALLPCPICSNSIFDSSEQLRDRLIFVSNNKIPCPVCQEEVIGIDKLTIHLFSHVQVSSIKICNQVEGPKETKTKNKIESQNLMLIQPKKSRQCNAKNKTHATPNVPVKYVKIYPKLPVISLNTVPVLPVDERIQITNSLYVPAVKTETPLIETNTTCYVCGLQFVDVNILRMHRCLIHNIEEKANTTLTRYQCHLCPKHFKMRGSLMVHLRVAHYGFASSVKSIQESDSKDTTLDSIKQSINNDNELVRIERSDNKQWQCDICRKSFTTKYFLKKHKRLHTGETPYACSQCNKTFTFQQSYHKHLLYHNDEKPHICTYCGRAFKELSTLHNHQRIHTGEKPFSCETCGKCFRQRVSYLVHKRIHTGVMPYKCTACDKSFRYKVSQRTHKCQAQPPGTVVRQSGELVEKLKKKLPEITTKVTENIHVSNYHDISETSVQLIRSGAKLSLEDTENEHFALINDPFEDILENNVANVNSNNQQQNNNVYMNASAEVFINTNDNKNVPSPSEILKNLCLSQNNDCLSQESQQDINFQEILKDLNEFL